jgi:hypothetical protein
MAKSEGFGVDNIANIRIQNFMIKEIDNEIYNLLKIRDIFSALIKFDEALASCTFLSSADSDTLFFNVVKDIFKKALFLLHPDQSRFQSSDSSNSKVNIQNSEIPSINRSDLVASIEKILNQEDVVGNYVTLEGIKSNLQVDIKNVPEFLKVFESAWIVLLKDINQALDSLEAHALVMSEIAAQLAGTSKLENLQQAIDASLSKCRVLKSLEESLEKLSSLTESVHQGNPPNQVGNTLTIHEIQQILSKGYNQLRETINLLLKAKQNLHLFQLEEQPWAIGVLYKFSDPSLHKYLDWYIAGNYQIDIDNETLNKIKNSPKNIASQEFDLIDSVFDTALDVFSTYASIIDEIQILFEGRRIGESSFKHVIEQNSLMYLEIQTFYRAYQNVCAGLNETRREKLNKFKFKRLNNMRVLGRDNFIKQLYKINVRVLVPEGDTCSIPKNLLIVSFLNACVGDIAVFRKFLSQLTVQANLCGSKTDSLNNEFSDASKLKELAGYYDCVLKDKKTSNDFVEEINQKIESESQSANEALKELFKNSELLSLFYGVTNLRQEGFEEYFVKNFTQIGCIAVAENILDALSLNLKHQTTTYREIISIILTIFRQDTVFFHKHFEKNFEDNIAQCNCYTPGELDKLVQDKIKDKTVIGLFKIFYQCIILALCNRILSSLQPKQEKLESIEPKKKQGRKTKKKDDLKSNEVNSNEINLNLKEQGYELYPTLPGSPQDLEIKKCIEVLKNYLKKSIKSQELFDAIYMLYHLLPSAYQNSFNNIIFNNNFAQLNLSEIKKTIDEVSIKFYHEGVLLDVAEIANDLNTALCINPPEHVESNNVWQAIKQYHALNLPKTIEAATKKLEKEWPEIPLALMEGALLKHVIGVHLECVEFIKKTLDIPESEQRNAISVDFGLIDIAWIFNCCLEIDGILKKLNTEAGIQELQSERTEQVFDKKFNGTIPEVAKKLTEESKKVLGKLCKDYGIDLKKLSSEATHNEIIGNNLKSYSRLIDQVSQGEKLFSDLDKPNAFSEKEIVLPIAYGLQFVVDFLNAFLEFYNVISNLKRDFEQFQSYISYIKMEDSVHSIKKGHSFLELCQDKKKEIESYLEKSNISSFPLLISKELEKFIKEKFPLESNIYNLTIFELYDLMMSSAQEELNQAIRELIHPFIQLNNLNQVKGKTLDKKIAKINSLLEDGKLSRILNTIFLRTIFTNKKLENGLGEKTVTQFLQDLLEKLKKEKVNQVKNEKLDQLDRLYRLVSQEVKQISEKFDAKVDAKVLKKLAAHIKQIHAQPRDCINSAIENLKESHDAYLCSLHKLCDALLENISQYRSFLIEIINDLSNQNLFQLKPEALKQELEGILNNKSRDERKAIVKRYLDYLIKLDLKEEETVLQNPVPIQVDTHESNQTQEDHSGYGEWKTQGRIRKKDENNNETKLQLDTRANSKTIPPSGKNKRKRRKGKNDTLKNSQKSESNAYQENPRSFVNTTNETNNETKLQLNTQVNSQIIPQSKESSEQNKRSQSSLFKADKNNNITNVQTKNAETQSTKALPPIDTTKHQEANAQLRQLKEKKLPEVSRQIQEDGIKTLSKSECKEITNAQSGQLKQDDQNQQDNQDQVAKLIKASGQIKKSDIEKLSESALKELKRRLERLKAKGMDEEKIQATCKLSVVDKFCNEISPEKNDAGVKPSEPNGSQQNVDVASYQNVTSTLPGDEQFIPSNHGNFLNIYAFVYQYQAWQRQLAYLKIEQLASTLPDRRQFISFLACGDYQNIYALAEHNLRNLSDPPAGYGGIYNICGDVIDKDWQQRQLTYSEIKRLAYFLLSPSQAYSGYIFAYLYFNQYVLHQGIIWQICSGVTVSNSENTHANNPFSLFNRNVAHNPYTQNYSGATLSPS